MKAVNLIPSEAGRAGGSRSGAASFVLLGVLAVMLAGVVAYVLTHNDVVKRRAEVAQLTTQVQAVRAQVDATSSYRDFASLAAARVQTVRELGESRFDWQRSLSDFAKVVPKNVWLTSMLGTVANGVAVDGGASGSTSSLRSALPNPAIELTGCTTSQDSVAKMISQLRLMRGVTRVALADSSKDGGGSSGGGGGCQASDNHIPQFDLVIFFDPIPALPVLASSTTATTTDTAATTPAATGTSSTDSGSTVR